MTCAPLVARCIRMSLAFGSDVSRFARANAKCASAGGLWFVVREETSGPATGRLAWRFVHQPQTTNHPPLDLRVAHPRRLALVLGDVDLEVREERRCLALEETHDRDSQSSDLEVGPFARS